MEIIHDGDPDLLELSDHGQPIQVTARPKDVMLDVEGNIALGHLSRENGGGVEAIVMLEHRTSTYACFGSIGLPEQLAAQPRETFSALAQKLRDEGKICADRNREVCITPPDAGIFSMFTLEHYTGNDRPPTIKVVAKGENMADTDFFEPDLLKYGELPVDETVIKLGQTVADIANALHEISGLATTAQLEIALPGAEIYSHHTVEMTPAAAAQDELPEPEALPEPAEPDCLPEHRHFPDFADFGGLDNEISRLKEAARDSIPGVLLEKYGLSPKRGIILQGPGGVGKTDLVRALAKDMRANLDEVRTSDIMSMWVGRSEENLRKLYNRVRSSGKPTVLFFDEFDGLFSANAGGNADGARSLIAEFKTILTNADRYPNVITIAAANSLANFDPALLRPGRFDTVIKIGLPATAARAQIFNKYLYKHARHFDVLSLSHIPENPIDSAALAELTTDFTGADIKCVISDLLWQKMRQERDNGVEPPRITQTELSRAIWQYRQNRPSDI